MKIMRGTCHLVALGVLALTQLSCEGPEPGLGQSSGPVIYGTDDRRQPFEVALPAADQLFAAEVALLSSTNGSIVPSGTGYMLATHPTFAEYKAPLCPAEPYREEPTLAFCSGFVVGPDLIATAGHCISKARECAKVLFVFGYQMLDAQTPPTFVEADDVYRCAQIVGRVQTSTNDWAIIRTDRPIVGHDPLPIRRAGAVESDPVVAQLAVVGHPVGLPTKLADNAQVMEASNPSYFSSNLDTYGGNSGSAVVSLDEAGNLRYVEGILVRGNPDFFNNGTCIESAVCSDLGCTGSLGSGWEEVTRTAMFADLVPAPPVCGDSVCAGGEDCQSCPEDCGDCPVCGDDICAGGETCQSCPGDCGDCPICKVKGDACSAGNECCSGLCHPTKQVCK